MCPTSWSAALQLAWVKCSFYITAGQLSSWFLFNLIILLNNLRSNDEHNPRKELLCRNDKMHIGFEWAVKICINFWKKLCAFARTCHKGRSSRAIWPGLHIPKSSYSILVFLFFFNISGAWKEINWSPTGSGFLHKRGKVVQLSLFFALLLWVYVQYF